MKDKKTILITGGSKRIGASIAEYFHEKSYKIILHFNKSEEEAKKLQDKLLSRRKDSCEIIQADFLKESSIQRAINSVLKSNKSLDVLVNNASSYFPTPLLKANKDEWNNLLTTNASVPFFIIQELKLILEKNKGCVINISDSMTNSGVKDYSVYLSAKSALESITRSLARELAPKIRVNAIAPGVILWPEKNILDEERKQKIVNKISLGRLGKPSEIAAVAYYLSQADYITGQTLKVDGGRSSL